MPPQVIPHFTLMQHQRVQISWQAIYEATNYCVQFFRRNFEEHNMCNITKVDYVYEVLSPADLACGKYFFNVLAQNIVGKSKSQRMKLINTGMIVQVAHINV